MSYQQHERIDATLYLQREALIRYFGGQRKGAIAILHRRLKELHGTSSLVDGLKASLTQLPAADDPRRGDNIERLVRSYCGLLGELRDLRLRRKNRLRWSPLSDKLFATLEAANSAASTVLGGKNAPALCIAGLFTADQWAPDAYTISPLWHRQIDAVGGPSIGHRFIARATLVDQVGEYDLFEVHYFENGSTYKIPQTGYVGRFRGTTIRGFGAQPLTALSWTRRQVVMRGTKALTK